MIGYVIIALIMFCVGYGSGKDMKDSDDFYVDNDNE